MGTKPRSACGMGLGVAVLSMVGVGGTGLGLGISVGGTCVGSGVGLGTGVGVSGAPPHAASNNIASSEINKRGDRATRERALGAALAFHIIAGRTFLN